MPPENSEIGAPKSGNSPSAKGMTVFRVAVPVNIRPGEEFQVYAGNRIVRVRCPLDSRPGQSLQITVPAETNGIGDNQNEADGGSNADSENNTASDHQNLASAFLSNNNIFGMDHRNSNGARNHSSRPVNLQTSLSSTELDNGVVRKITGSDPPAYMISIPEGVIAGQQFSVAIRGQQLMVTCPSNAGPGMSVRIVPPPLPDGRPSSPPDELRRISTDNSLLSIGLPPTTDLRQNISNFGEAGLSERQQKLDGEKSQLFEVEVPSGVQPGAPFALLAGGVRVLVTCPSNAGPGQKIRFKLPLALTQQQMNANNRQSPNEMQQIKLSYDKDGWTRTVRATDFKFQWIRMDEKGDIDVDVMAGRGGRRRFHMDKSAYVRRLEFKLGEDPRIRTGLLSLVPATESVVDSKIKSADGRDLVTYGDLAAAQMKSFGEKTEWFQDTCAKLCVEWNEGHMRMNIRRQYLLGDSIDAVMSLSRKDLRKLWRFEFIGEMGIDAGGLAREWFELVCKEIFDPDMGLWTSSVTNQMSMTINPASGTCVLYFRINVLISFCAAFVSTNNLSNFARCSAWFLLSTS